MGFEFFGNLLAAVFNGATILYWVVTALLLFGISRSKWPHLVKAVAGLVTVSFLIGWPVRNEMLLRQQEDAARQRLAKAEAIFNERCKGAGEKIYRTVEGVGGIMLLKLRPTDYNPSKQDATDPYGYDYDWNTTTEAYIATFLWGRDAKGFLVEKEPGEKPGYRFVEAVDPKTGVRLRYTGRIDQPWLRDKRYGEWVRDFLLDKTPAAGPPPRYGVTYDDITTSEERAFWIAGSSLKVIDTAMNEVVAERIGYMIDRGLGSTAGFRQPWTYALKTPGWSCPDNKGSGQTRNFVEKVLKIRGE